MLVLRFSSFLCDFEAERLRNSIFQASRSAGDQFPEVCTPYALKIDKLKIGWSRVDLRVQII